MDTSRIKSEAQSEEIVYIANDANSGTEQTSTPSTAYCALVVEDEALTRLDIVEALEEAGFEVVGQTGDSEKAIELTVEFDSDLVVIGVRIPGMDGVTAIEKILATKRCAIVVLTAFSQSELVRRARDTGAMAYVARPFTPADLTPAVKIALSHSQEILTLENEVSNLTEQSETRKRIGQVKGPLEAKMRLSEPEAFRRTQKTSMDRRLTMRGITDAIIEQIGDHD